jgi:glutaredoxin|tara:strand:+ start:268 stop:447 length:180 start_codon:yes stop_codon:yes gene_type:complete
MLLQSRGIDYSTKLVTFSKKKSIREMAKKTGGKTSIPQIFVDDKYFGGLLELKEYYKEK